MLAAVDGVQEPEPVGAFVAAVDGVQEPVGALLAVLVIFKYSDEDFDRMFHLKKKEKKDEEE